MFTVTAGYPRDTSSAKFTGLTPLVENQQTENIHFFSAEMSPAFFHSTKAK